MMLYSANRNILRRGQASTVLEQVKSDGSNEDNSSDFESEDR